ncbi:MAG: GFA family protein, partial [Sphingomicrobium sp.]
MTTRTASCRCGQLTATVEGEPVRISVCHCLACQKRTGSAFSAQARWPTECLEVEGRSKQWTRTADSGQQTTYNFCP